MNKQELDRLETFIRQQSGRFPYPPTPDLASRVQREIAPALARVQPDRRRLAWAVAALLLALSLVALSVPPVRAAIFEFFQIGAIRVFSGDTLNEPSTTPVLPPATHPFPPDLVGETTLVAAAEETGLDLLLPAYPAGIGPPDHVFVQDVGAPMVILAWVDPVDPDLVSLSLFFIGSTETPLGTKFEVRQTEETTVKGQPALWVSGNHMLQFEADPGQDSMRMTRLVGTHTLIWQADGVTYRLEADLPLPELVRIAESLE